MSGLTDTRGAGIHHQLLMKYRPWLKSHSGRPSLDGPGHADDETDAQRANLIAPRL